MVEATFFTQKGKSATKCDQQPYYIPIVEVMNDMLQLSAWRYARNPLVTRLFYKSTEDLFFQEGVKAGRTTLSCYKVLLNTQQMTALNENQIDGKGHPMKLNFMPKDILSCIKISGNECIEVKNPFYRINETTLQEIPTASFIQR